MKASQLTDEQLLWNTQQKALSFLSADPADHTIKAIEAELDEFYIELRRRGIYKYDTSK